MKKNIAIIHPKLGWGGSEATVFWMLQALRDDYDISFVTNGRVDFFSINKYYGTALKPGDFSVIQIPMPLGLKNTHKFAALRGRFIQRYFQRIASKYDLMINAYNPCDFKTSGIQFATDMMELPEIIPLSTLGKIFYGRTFLRKIYLHLCDLISVSRPEEWKKNLTISNSNWTANLMFERYSINAQTIYPPVAANFPDIPFEDKENGFVCVGRLVPEKRIDLAIEILKEVRKRGHNVHLHIIGGTGDKKYMRTLENLYLDNKDWIFLEGRLDEENKKNLIASHKFGISCRENEPFGIAVAEMVKAGCIIFVSGGGQAEIVDSSHLVYKDKSDAVTKIDAVLRSGNAQNELRNHLTSRSREFSTENFENNIRNIIKKWFC